ncbi:MULTISPECIES: TIGR03792 family protein [Cyanophyceae]|uniref:TIGR03792 family protein n=1 Tax=Leptolyngbya subtilissima DQ-A4 TaxID=2933933 RepID=A0ABV0K7D7_9CYAN|nr:TIGR03792 family protein [Nodosilinea sp. FACHB-141]MBD2114746.1 TIGR03792 family protein [Nodosilinea sp. FACHB-141]
MVIEWLTFAVDPENRETFVRLDNDIWTAALSQYPGFVSKEVWISPDLLDQVVYVVRWQTREQWKAIPQADLDAIEQQFDAAVNFSYRMIDAREYQVRRYPSP